MTVQSGLCVQSAAKVPADPKPGIRNPGCILVFVGFNFLAWCADISVSDSFCTMYSECLISLHIKMKPPGVSDSTIVITVKTDLCVQSVPKLPRDLCQISTILQPTYDTWLLMQKLLNIHLSSDTMALYAACYIWIDFQLYTRNISSLLSLSWKGITLDVILSSEAEL